ncbi:MAG TPA: hypothetical protein VNW97_02040 [Candidatus Saccharimonadales bacterium]|nr:hypothetical protein [Candidatus Saccharimonadales bacterium]
MLLLVCMTAWLLPVPVCAQTATVSGVVAITGRQTRHKRAGNAGVVVWLTPAGAAAAPEPAATGTSATPAEKGRFTLLQKNKTFEPHILVVPIGSEVDFPNRDPIFHNVFSLFEGKRFDLGLYEAGTKRSLHFNRPGISYLFCNIHPEMSAVIVAVETRYYSTSDHTGQIAISEVPAGNYILHVWREGSSIGALKGLTRPISVSGSQVSFEKVLVPDDEALPLAHKNKYGQDYTNPTPPGQIYDRP